MITALSSRGQIVLPKKLRNALNLVEGTQFVVFSDRDNILLKPIKPPEKSDFAGVLRQVANWAKNSGICEDARIRRRQAGVMGFFLLVGKVQGGRICIE